MSMAATQAWSWSAATIARRVRAGDVSARAVVDACLHRTHSVEPALNAYLEVFDPAARERADALDRRRRRGETLGALAGVPVAVKDNLNIAGQALSCGSRLLEGYRAPYTATAVERLLRADAVLLGRTNLDEFAMGSSGETSAFGATRNPWARERVPGGSSSGSAAAVAAGSVPLALGSDTGGSVRQPAALCGLVGVKPTYGRVSRYGLTAYASSLDQVGPLARDANDAALALAVLSGHDPCDATSSRRAPPQLGSEVRWRGLRAGVPRELSLDALSHAAASNWTEALERVRGLGGEVVEVSVPALPRALAVYSLIANSEASSNLARFDGVRFGTRPPRPRGEDVDASITHARSQGFGAEVQRRILLGTFALSAGYRHAYYARACRLRAALASQLRDALCSVDLLLTPTTPSAAFPLGEMVGASLQMALSDLFTVPASLAGLPAVAVPSGYSDDDMPLSLQLIGDAFDEARLLPLAQAFQDHVEWEVRPARPAAL